MRGWVVSGTFRRRSGGEITIEELTLKPEFTAEALATTEPHRPDAPGSGVSSAMLRQLPISYIKVRILAKLNQAARSAVAEHLVADDPEARRAWAQLVTATRVAPRAHRRAHREAAQTLTDSHLRYVAEAWLKEIEQGRGAWQRMLTRFAGETDSVQTIRRWIKRARAEGWLAQWEDPNEGRGQLRAEPGPKLIEYRAERAAKRARKEGEK